MEIKHLKCKYEKLNLTNYYIENKNKEIIFLIM